MTPKNLAYVLLMQGLLLNAQEFTGVYSFSEVTSSSGSVAPGAVPQVQGLSFGTFTAVGVSLNPNASGRLSFTGWPVGAVDEEDDYTLFTGNLSPFSYYEFSVGVVPGYTLQLNDLSFSVRRSGTGIRHYCVRSDMDGFTSNLAAATGTNNKLGVLPDNVFFWKHDNTSSSSDQRGSIVATGPVHKNVTGSVRFRFYAWNAETGNGSFSIDNVTVTGQVLDSALLSGMASYEREHCVLRLGVQNIRVDCDWNEIELYDLNGKLLYQFKQPFTSGFPALVPGMYLVLIRTPATLKVSRLLVPFR